MPNETMPETEQPHIALSALVVTALEPLLPPTEAPISYLRLELTQDYHGSVRWCEARTMRHADGYAVPHYGEHAIEGFDAQLPWYQALAEVVQLPPLMQRMVLTIEANRLPRLETTLLLRTL